MKIMVPTLSGWAEDSVSVSKPSDTVRTSPWFLPDYCPLSAIPITTTNVIKCLNFTKAIHGQTQGKTKLVRDINSPGQGGTYLHTEGET